MTQLYVVDVVQSTSFVAFAAAGGAHLKALVTPAQRMIATSRFETPTGCAGRSGLRWAACSSARWARPRRCSWTRCRSCSPRWACARSGGRNRHHRRPGGPRRRDLGVGWRYVLGHPQLRPLFANALLFSGSVLMAAPLETVLMLRDLGFTPWEYGLVLGLPCLGGLLGAGLAPRLRARLGPHRLLRYSGIARTPWLLAIPFAGRVPRASSCCSRRLRAAAPRRRVQPDVRRPTAGRQPATDVLARVLTTWSISSPTVKHFHRGGGMRWRRSGVRVAIGWAGCCACSARCCCRAIACLRPSKRLCARSRHPIGSTAPTCGDRRKRR